MAVASGAPEQLMGLVPKPSGLRGIRNKIHNIYPVGNSGNSAFSYNGQSQIVFNIPSFKSSWLNPQRTYLRYKFKSDVGSFPVGGVHPFSRLQLRVGNSVVEDILSYDVLDRLHKNMESYCSKKTSSYMSGDMRAEEISDQTTLMDIFNNGTTIEHGLISGVLGRDFNDHYIPIGFFNQSGTEAMSLTLHLNDPNMVCVTAGVGDHGYELTEVELVTEIVELPSSVNERLDKELYNGGKVSLPFATHRLHINHIPQGSQQVEIQILDNAMDLENIIMATRKQSLLPISDYAGAGNSNFDFELGHGDRATADTDVAYATNKLKTLQFSCDTQLYPQKRLENSERDTKATMHHNLATLDLWKDDAYFGGYNGDGKAVFDNFGTFFMAQSFKTSRDKDLNNAINASATGAGVMCSIGLAKPATSPLRIETFVKGNYTLNIGRGGTTTVLNATSRETPVA